MKISRQNLHKIEKEKWFGSNHHKLRSENKHKNCNCRNKDNCPLDRKCLVECIAYEARVSTMNQTNTYFGLVGGNFKSRYNNHTLAFGTKGYKHHTELSKHIWSLKDSNTRFSFKWHIKTKAMPYQCGS